MDGQMDIFDFIDSATENSKAFKITKPTRLIELFGGVGTQAMAMERLGVDFEHYKLVEFDKYAVASYNNIHGTGFGVTDIKDVHAEDLRIVDTDKYNYIMTYSFPCTDLSVAGYGHGMAENSGTHSALLWEVKRILEECKKLNCNMNSVCEIYGMPQVLLMENVIQVHSNSNKNIEHFNRWLNFLEELGYKNFWQDLNAKDYGVPQNRNRCFCISILGNFEYTFPEPIPLECCIEDFLEPEENIKPKFMVSEEKQKIFLENLIEEERKVLHEATKGGKKIFFGTKEHLLNE